MKTIIKNHNSTKRYTRLTNNDALKLWRAIYKKRCWTERGSQWGWAEIDNGVRKVFITTHGTENLLDAIINDRSRIIITIGL